MAMAGPGGIAVAQPQHVLTPPEASQLERIAVGRARGELFKNILALPLESGTVRDVVADDADLQRELRIWTRGVPRTRMARLYSDKTCEADVRVGPADLRDKLAALIAHYKSPNADPLVAAVRSAAVSWPAVWGTGGSAWKDQPRGTAHKPPGWEDVSFEGIEATRRAATADALSGLIARASRLKLGPERTLNDFFDSNARIRPALQEGLQHAASIRVVTGTDELAQAEAQVSIGALAKLLDELRERHAAGSGFSSDDFRELALQAPVSELRSVGLAAPSDKYSLRARLRDIDLDVPSWAMTSLSARGRYVPSQHEGLPAEDSPPALPEGVKLEMARLDGLNALRAQVEALVIQPGVTVEQFLSYYPGLKNDVVIFLSGARVSERPSGGADGSLEVTVELSCERLWSIVRRGMATVEVDPPVTQPGASGERGQ